MRKKILITIGIIICVAVTIGIYLYQKPRAIAGNQKADFEVTASSLYKQFETDETTASQKYSGKILEITGMIGDVQKSDSTLSVLLTAGEAMGGVNCSMVTTEDNLKQGETVIIKGKCTGFLMDVSIVDAVLIQSK